MSKKFFFSFLAIIFSSFFIYTLIFIFYFNNLEKNFEENFKEKKTAQFYKKYSDKIHHIRYTDNFRFEIKTDELIFNYLKNEIGDSILLQGDSWFKKINNYESSQKIILKNLSHFGKIINGGTSSYSPSLMYNQFLILEKDYNIKPNKLIIYIDQTDMGDELCRYKNLIRNDEKKNFLKVQFEKFPYHQGVFNLHEKIYLSEIELSDATKIIKTQYFINYKAKKAYKRLQKKIKSLIDKDQDLKKCEWSIIESYKSNLKANDREYLKKTIGNYFNYLNDKNFIEKIYVVTHPHKLQFMTETQNIDISNIVSEITMEYKKIHHINFSKILETKNFYEDFEKIWKLDLIHLTEDGYNKFLNELFRQIKVLK